MKVILCHPGTQYSQYLASQLYHKNLLLNFYTGLAFGHDHFLVKLLKFLPKKISQKAEARIIRTLPDRFIKRSIYQELKSLYLIRQGANPEIIYYKRNKNVQTNIPDFELNKADVVIGFDTASWILAERCKQLKKPFILDVSIGHPVSKNKIYSNLSEKYPEWSEQILIKEQKLLDLEQLEAELAFKIVAPSQFVKDTLIENRISANKILVNPFGTNTEYFEYHEKKSSEKLRFLFFGGLNIRKGLPFLLSVWRTHNFENAELTIAGFGKLPAVYHLPKNVKNLGKISLDERNSLFKSHDVFIFPSNFEGFAQVQIEAAACGLPIITTPNAGGLEIVKDDINGYIIESENEVELSNSIMKFITNPSLLSKMSKNQKNIIGNFTWEAYGNRWETIINNVINEGAY